MAWRSYLGGRYSPFAGPPQPAPPRVTEDDYHYLGPEDIVDPPRAYNHHPRVPQDDASQPDVLILKHRGTTYPLHFPAYSIGEGILRVGELRRYAADKTGASDPRRVKLLYKGHELKDDAVACCEEGLKQNSELMCVVREAPPSGNRRRGDDADGSRLESDDSASDEEMLRGARQGRRAESAVDTMGPRVNVDGTIIDDGPPRRRRHAGPGSGSTAAPSATERPNRRSDEANTGRSDGYLHPKTNTTVPAAGSSTTPAVPTPSASPKPQAVPNTQREKLDAIADTLRTKWTPLVKQFAASPPRETKARHQEYTKLSESILQQVLLKLDDIVTDGDTELRTQRKAMIVETQNVLGELDAAKSRHG